MDLRDTGVTFWRPSHTITSHTFAVSDDPVDDADSVRSMCTPVLTKSRPAHYQKRQGNYPL